MRLFINKNISNERPTPAKVIFAEMGQSNMLGYNGDTGNPDYPFNSTIGALNWTGSEFVTLNTLRGGAVGGSHANYFADRLYSVANIQAVMVNGSTGSTGLTEVSQPSNNYSATGTRRAAIETILNSCIAELPNIPVCGLWSQGERDARELDSNVDYTFAIVKAAMQSVIDWWQSTYVGAPFLISQTGTATSGDTQGWQDMRLMQTQIADENDNVFMAFNGAVDFVNEGKMADLVHYNFTGLEEMGQSFANKYNEIK
jgi:hypothetical protein